jgi:predicted transcriptional regulator
MEVHFTPEQEVRLLKIAMHEGIDPAQLVKEAALRLLEDDARFRNAVRQGIQQADQGQLIEEDEMDARVRRLFPS